MTLRVTPLAPLAPDLLVGPGPTTIEHVEALAAHGVTGLLSLQTDEDLGARGLRWPLLWQLHMGRGINAQRSPIRDFDKRDMLVHIDDALAVLDGLLASHQRIYVHCSAGINRSPSICIAHLARTVGLEAAYRAVTTAHPDAVPYPDVLTKWARKRGVAP